MKELSIEDKAKRYDKAIERARKILKRGYYISGDIESMFSELKESEDERIRKALIDFFSISAENGEQTNGVCDKEILAWLEKQGESYTKRDVDDAYLKGVTNTKNEIEKQYEANYQIRKDISTFIFNYKGDIKDRAKWMDYLGFKVSFAGMQGEEKPADKVEPKFHEGEWCIDNEDGTIFQIVKVLDNTYTYKTNEGKEYSCTHYSLENDARLWTIQDAKDGDVLATLDYILVFKKFLKNDGGISYCHYDFGAGNPQFIWSEDKNWYFGKKVIIHPATKEQRDLLFQKMKEAGYEWDAEKKELKKIIDEKQIKKNLQDNSFRRMFEQNPAWSEEDEKFVHGLIRGLSAKRDIHGHTTFSSDGIDITKTIDWLKSLKDRVQPQPKQEWSKEDEQITLSIEQVMNCASLLNIVPEKIDKIKTWLKSLRPQNTWKPSEEQITVLHDVATYIDNSIYPNQKDVLVNLYLQLKKLREE